MPNREIPFLNICLSLCLGIITGRFIHPAITGFIILFILSSVLFAVSLFFNRRLTNPLFGIALSFSLFSCGLFLFTEERNRISDLHEEEAIFSGIVSEFPEEKENTLMLPVRLNSEITSSIPKKIRVSLLLYHKKDSISRSFVPGDNVVIRCTPVAITNRGNPYEFDYKFYMESQGIKYYSFTSNDDLISVNHPDKRRIRDLALIIRNRIIEMFRERGITGRRLALASAITLGEKSHLEPEQKQYFINAGIMHIMAVSGLHAVILSYFIYNILFFLKGRFNILRIVITLLILWSFAFITGLTPSVLRATMMFTFLQTGKLIKRPVNSVNSVLASAFVLILIRPSVIFDAGFLLSYSAVLYIIVFYQDLYLQIRFRHRIPDLIWQSAALTIAAQAGTLPLTIMLFNRFPTYFILTNVIIVPVSSLLIITGCLVPVTFPLIHISGFLAKMTGLLTSLTEYLTAKAASLPFAAIDGIGLTTPQCILLTVLISLLLFFLLRKPRISVIYPMVAFILFLISVSVRHYITGSTDELIVYNTPGETAIGLRTGRILRLFTEKENIPKDIMRHCAILGLKIQNEHLPGDPLFMRINNHILLITGSYEPGLTNNQAPDISIFTSRIPFPGKESGLIFPEGSVIITTDYNHETEFCCSGDSGKMNRTWSVRKSGAYRKTL